MADTKTLEQQVDAAIAGESSAAVAAAGDAAAPILADRLGAASARDREAIAALLGAVGTTAAAEVLAPLLADRAPSVRGRAAAEILTVVLSRGEGAAPPLAPYLPTALEDDEPDGAILLLAGLVPEAKPALTRAQASTRLVKAAQFGPAVPARLAALIALSRHGDSAARAELEGAIAEAEAPALEFILRAAPLIDAPELLHAVADRALSNETEIADGRPSGIEPPRQLADLAVELLAKRLALSPSFALDPEGVYTEAQRDEIANLIAGAIPR